MLHKKAVCLFAKPASIIATTDDARTRVADVLSNLKPTCIPNAARLGNGNL
jgi:hypothetical protein